MENTILNTHDLLVRMENTGEDIIYRDKRRSGFVYLEIDGTGEFLEIAPDGKRGLVDDYRLVEHKTCPECGYPMEAIAFGNRYDALYRCQCGHEEREGTLFRELLYPIDLTSDHISCAHWLVLMFGGSSDESERAIADIVKVGLTRYTLTESSSPDVVNDYVMVRHPAEKTIKLLSDMKDQYQRGLL